MASVYTNLLKQKKAFAYEKSSTPRGLIWDPNMAAFLLFWDTNMAAMTSCENTLYLERGYFFLENFHRNEPFHLNSPELPAGVFHTNRKRSSIRVRIYAKGKLTRKFQMKCRRLKRHEKLKHEKQATTAGLTFAD